MASLLHVADAEGPGEPVELGDVANFSMVTMYRNGVFISANETGYSFTCSVIGHEYITVSGQIDPSTARSKCSLDLDSLPPNMYRKSLRNRRSCTITNIQENHCSTKPIGY